MQVREIYAFLNELSPFELQEKWDNSGLLVGSMEDEFTSVTVSIDLDLELLENAQEKTLFIVHHPLIFAPLRSVNYDSYATKLLKLLIQKNCVLIAMHTNIDKTHLNNYVAKEVLGLDVIESEDYITYANVDVSFEDFALEIATKLGHNYLKTVKCHESLKKVALVTGAGMSLINEVDADCFLTGDIKYHDAMEAKARGISLIDVRHYESEQHFSPLLMGLIEEYLKKNKLKAIISASKNPFMYKSL